MVGKELKIPCCSIVIRAFNEEKHIGRLLDAIQQQTLRKVEIILVDSGSTDNTATVVSRYPVKLLHIRPQDFTFGRSLNMGLRSAVAEFAVMASAHVYPLGNDWLENLLAPFSDSKVAMVYGRQRGGEHCRFSEAQHFIRWFPETSDDDQQHAYCNNANAALRLSIWKRNPFDENLTGLEDLAWGSWAQEQGYKIAYTADAGVIHLHDEDAAQIVNRHRREAIALKRILPKSRFTFWHFGSLLFRSVFSDFRAALRQRVLIRETLDIISFRFLQYWGTYRGYHDPTEPGPELRQVFYYPPGLLEKRRSTPENSASGVYKEGRKSA